MRKALYRKYRPRTLDEVVGEPQVTNLLKSSLANGHIFHAYLFIGPRGCGKTSVARIFAHELNHFSYELEDDYVDIIEIDAASNTGVDNIRELREKATIAPSKGKYKVYIIDEVHMLSKSAFNALLKTLEEPPAHVIFIMATTDAYKVPVTIVSRSQVYNFKLADATTMFKHLSNICQQEQIQIDDDALNLIVKHGGGSFRDSLSLLDQISTLSDSQITKDLVINSLGLAADDIVANILAAYTASDFNNIVLHLKNLLSANVKPENIAEELIRQIIDNPKPILLPLLSKLPEVKSPFSEAKLITALLSDIVPSTIPAPIPRPMPQPTPQPISQPAPRPLPPSAPTAPQNTPPSLDDFLASVKNRNDAIYAQLLKTVLKIADNILHIYPEKKIVKSILSRDNNKRLLIESANGLKIEIHEVEDLENVQQKDPLVSKISDIMGTVEEVTQNGGEIPF